MVMVKAETQMRSNTPGGRDRQPRSFCRRARRSRSLL